MAIFVFFGFSCKAVWLFGENGDSLLHPHPYPQGFGPVSMFLGRDVKRDRERESIHIEIGLNCKVSFVCGGYIN